MNVKQAAKRLNADESQVRRWLKNGDIKGHLTITTKTITRNFHVWEADSNSVEEFAKKKK